MLHDLPFLQAPKAPTTRRCGNEASGILELPVYGGLRVSETTLITELLSNGDSVFVKAAQLSDAISKAEDISITEAYDLVERAVTNRELEPEAKPIQLRHAKAIEQLSRDYLTAGRRNLLATVTAMVACRLNRPDWTMEATSTLLDPLFDDIWALAEEERRSEPKTEAAPPDDEQLGKPPEESGASPKPTGRRSRGI